MLDAKKLAEDIAEVVGSDGVTPEGEAYAKGLIASLKATVVTFLPGSINGTTLAAAPIVAASGSMGTLLITPIPMIAATATTLLGTNTASEHAAIIQYILTGLVSFTPGQITGSCTSTPTTPGPLVAGAANGGKINGLTGAGAVATVMASIGPLGPQAIDIYTAITSYILKNAEVSFVTGGIVGVCPPGGGPLTLGAGIAGIVS